MVDPIELKFFTDKITSFELKSSDGESEFYVEGYASTPDLDLVGDIVTPKALESMAEQIKERVIKIDVEHESWKPGGSPNIVPIGKVVDARVDKKGLWVRVKMNPAASKFSEVWKSIKGGFIDAFSIAFNNVKAVERHINGVATRVISDLHLLNIALTGNPANPMCKMSDVMAKSLEYAEIISGDGPQYGVLNDTTYTKSVDSPVDYQKICDSYDERLNLFLKNTVHNSTFENDNEQSFLLSYDKSANHHSYLKDIVSKHIEKNNSLNKTLSFLKEGVQIHNCSICKSIFSVCNDDEILLGEFLIAKTLSMKTNKNDDSSIHLKDILTSLYCSSDRQQKSSLLSHIDQKSFFAYYEDIHNQYLNIVQKEVNSIEKKNVEEKFMADLEELRNQLAEMKALQEKNVEKDEQITKLSAQMKALDNALNQLQLKTRAEMPEPKQQPSPMSKPLDFFK